MTTPLKDPLRGKTGHKYELLCQHIALGQPIREAWKGTGLSRSTCRIAVSRYPEIQNRIQKIQQEIKDKAVEKAAADAVWIDKKTRQVVEHSMRKVPLVHHSKPVLDAEGNGVLKFLDPGAALKGLELMGKHRGMYTDRVTISEAEQKIDSMTDEELRAWVKNKEEALAGRSAARAGDGAAGGGAQEDGALQPGDAPRTLQ